MSERALAGRSVVVTRAPEQASRMVERLASLGASVVELPVIATEAAPDGGAALAEAAGRLAEGRYGWVALTSANAANRLLGQLGPYANAAPAKWAALGEGTAAALRRAGVEPEVVADVSTSGRPARRVPARPDRQWRVRRRSSTNRPVPEGREGARRPGGRSARPRVGRRRGRRLPDGASRPVTGLDRPCAPRRRDRVHLLLDGRARPCASSDAKASRRRSRRSGPPRRAPRGKKASR